MEEDIKGRDIMEVDKNSLEIIVEKLIQEAYELLPKTIKAIKKTDVKAKQRGEDWTNRHRLGVLLEAAEETLKSLPDVAVAPWFIAELKATLAVVRRWKDRPYWKGIEKHLKDPNCFKHNILTIQTAEQLEMDGHKVELVPTKKSHTPDLVVYTISGKQGPVYFECYQPEALCGKTPDLSIEETEKIVAHSMDKVDEQLDRKNPGILAICGYNQSSKDKEILKQTIEKRLQNTSPPNLGGMLLIYLGVRFRLGKEGILVTPTRSADFIHNPSYFGGADIVYKIPQNHPQLIKEPSIDVKTDDLKSGDINEITKLLAASDLDKIPQKKARSKVTRTKKLNLIEKPKKSSRTVVHCKGTMSPPMFEGEGNIDYLCGKCETILAKYVWEPSISNIVLECPNCQSYDEFPLLTDSDFKKFPLTKGNIYIQGPIKVKRGLRIEGG